MTDLDHSRLEHGHCYRALQARDPRFDGLFYVGVATTGIYCRPICTARTPGRSRCTFYRSAPEAERAGFRACFVCRPELAPGCAPVDSVPRLVREASAAINDGALNGGSVAALASRFGVSDRHLRRAFNRELGVSPVQLAQSRRLALAKQLLQDSGSSLAEIAFASGFGSVRRFNAAFLERFGRAPSSLRRRAEGRGLNLRLDYRPPMAWARLLGFLAARAIPGVERVEGETYSRVLRLGERVGLVHVAQERRSLRVQVAPSLLGDLMPLVSRLRRLFDLDARPQRIAAHLSSDPVLTPLVEAWPGLRLPGCVDAFEVSARAILGQHISVKAANTIAGRLVETFGSPVAEAEPGLSHRFPTAQELAATSVEAIAALGIPARRAAALRDVAALFVEGEHELVERLLAVKGIGEWTANYIAMRALSDPDAFPAGDLVLRRALGDLTARAARTRSEAWRPWRAYAALYLWQGESQ